MSTTELRCSLKWIRSVWASALVSTTIILELRSFFHAESLAGDDYLIDKWYGLDADVGSSEASITVSENTRLVWLTFKKKKVSVSFSGTDNNKDGRVTATVNGSTINSGALVEKGTVVLFTANAKTGYEADR